MDATRLSLSQTAAKYTQSTLSYISVIGLNSAINSLLTIGIEEIYNHARGLSNILIPGLKDLSWNSFQKINSVEFSPHIIAISGPTFNVQAKFAELQKNNIICGVRNERIRISIAHYNNELDIEALIKNL